MKYFYLILIITVVGLGAYIRLAPILAGDTLFQFDHGRDLWDVKKIVYDGDFTLIGPDTGLHGVFNGPYHYYLLALPVWLSNGHPLSGTYFNAFLHILAIYLCFELGKRMMRDFGIKNEELRAKNERKAVLFGLIVATIFAFARGAVGSTIFFWNPNWIPALMVPWVYFMWRGVIRHDRWGLIWAGFFGGMMGNVEVAYGLWMLPVYVVVVLVLWPQAWKRLWAWLGIGAYGLHFIPHLIFDLRNNFLMTNAIFGLFTGKNVSLGVSIPWPDRLWVRAQELYAVTGGNLSAHENATFSLILTCFLLLSLVVMFFFARKMQSTQCEINASSVQKEIVFFILPIFVYYLCFLVYPRIAWPWYWIGLQTVFYFLCAYVVWRSWLAGWFVGGLAGGLLVTWLIITVPYYFKEPTFLEQEPGRFSNMMRVVDSVFEDAQDGQFAVYTYTPPIKDHAFGYLFWWRGRTRHNYVPYTAYALRDGEAIPETVYLVIDPPCASYDTPVSCDAKSVQLKGWLETSTPKGDVVWEKDYVGRLKVIKRKIEYNAQ